MKHFLLLLFLCAAVAARAQELTGSCGIIFPSDFYRNFRTVPGFIAALSFINTQSDHLQYGFVADAHALQLRPEADSLSYKMVLGAPLASLAFLLNYRYPLRGGSYLFAGARLGFASSKVRQHNNTSSYSSGAGTVAGIQLGLVWMCYARVGVFAEVTPRYYNLGWDSNLPRPKEQGNFYAVPVTAGLRVVL